MKSILLSLAILSLSVTAQSHENHENHEKISMEKMATKTKTFGGKMMDQKPITLSDVTANFDKYEGKKVTLTATAKKVCKEKGCWMVITDGSQEVRTLFKDYGFFVPTKILNKKVRVQGIMEQKKVSAAKIRHFMKDGGASRKEINKIKKAQTKFQFTADAVEII